MTLKLKASLEPGGIGLGPAEGGATGGPPDPRFTGSVGDGPPPAVHRSASTPRHVRLITIYDVLMLMASLFCVRGVAHAGPIQRAHSLCRRRRARFEILISSALTPHFTSRGFA